MILEAREKIAMLRKEYKITQTELSQEGFSQSYIAAVENGSRKLSEDSLIYFVDTFNKIFKERKIDREITLDWLNESIESQVKHRYDYYLTKILTTESREYIEELDKELEKEEEFFSIMQKSFLHHYIAVFYMEINDYTEAYEAYRKIYFFLNEIEDKELLSKIIYNILSILKDIGKFERVKEFEELLELERENIEKHYLIYIYDLLIELFNEVEDYEAVLRYLEELEKISPEKDMEKIRFNKLQVYINLGILDKAKKLYSRIDKEIGNYLYSYQFYFKLQGLELYRALKKKSNVRKLYKEIQEIQEKVEIILDTRSFFILGEAAGFLNKKVDMMKYLTFACSMFDFSDYSSVELKYFRDILIKTLPECKKRDLIIVRGLWTKAKELMEEKGDNQYIFHFIEYFLTYKYYKELKEINAEILEFYQKKDNEDKVI